jgi:hypothetical protein
MVVKQCYEIGHREVYKIRVPLKFSRKKKKKKKRPQGFLLEATSPLALRC